MTLNMAFRRLLRCIWRLSVVSSQVTRWRVVMVTKGCITIMPVEDMPYDENGNPVDIGTKPIGRTISYEYRSGARDPFGMAAKGLGDKINAMLRSQVAVRSQSS